MSSSYSSYTNSPCAACKFLRRKCTSDCVFAPYFPPEEPTKFANVHRIFGASNVSKILQEVAPHQREDAVNSLAYEAEARLRDPVYGCVGAISVLQRQVLGLQRELEETNADIMRYASCLGGETSSVYGARRGWLVNEKSSNICWWEHPSMYMCMLICNMHMRMYNLNCILFYMGGQRIFVNMPNKQI